MKKLILLLKIGFALSAAAEDIEGLSAVLRGVDKITGRTQTIEIPVGETKKMGDLKITLERCLKKPPEEMPENAAFLLVEEKNKDNDSKVVFNGWMFSSNPAISAMEHPIWDIWVLECGGGSQPSKTLVPRLPNTPPSVQTDNPVTAEDLGEI